MEKMTDFRFDEANHEYFVGGVRWPGISELFKEFGLVDDRFYTEHGKTRGHAVHKACALYDIGELDKYELDPVTVPYVEAYRRYMNEGGLAKDKWTHIEQPMFSAEYGFCGTPDRVLTSSQRNDMDTVFEIKTGSIHPTVRLQTAAQAILVGFVYPKRLVLQLKETGNYKLTALPPQDFEHDREDFLALVRTWWLKKTGSYPPVVQ